MIESDVTSMMDQINMSNPPLAQSDSPKPPEPTTVVPTNRRAPPFESGHSTEVSGMWTLNMRSDHQIYMDSSSRSK